MSAGQLLKAGTLTLPSHSLKENPWQIVFGDIACSILHRLRGVSDKGYVKRHPMLSSLITCWNLPVVNLAEKYHNFCIFHTKTLRSRKLKDEFKSLSPASLFFLFFFFFFFWPGGLPWLSFNFFYFYSANSESHSVMSDSLRPHGLYSLWNSPDQNTGVGSPYLLPTQGSNPILPNPGGFFTS